MCLTKGSVVKKAVKIIIILIILAGLGALGWHYWGHRQPEPFVLYGNVDQRQVELAFIDSERIAEVLVEEGEIVEPGQVVARLETRRLRDRIAALEAQVKASEITLTKLQNGTRPEEIDQARSAVESAKSDVDYANNQYERYRELWEKSPNSISVKDVDQWRNQLKVAREQLVQAEKSLALALEGPRWEDVAEAGANLELNRRNLAEQQNRLKDAELTGPSRTVVRRRLMEPGDMASPQKPVLSLAVLSPKWVRAYVSEAQLGFVKPGMDATVTIDSYPDQGIPGKVGFISSVAEFTPKTVQTTELRTSLVYEVRVYVDDHDDRLRLGMPATVSFPDHPAQATHD